MSLIIFFVEGRKYSKFVVSLLVQIFVRQQDLDASAKATVTISKLSMIDLAGSERGAATGFGGVRFKEGSSINKSLLALGECLCVCALVTLVLYCIFY